MRHYTIPLLFALLAHLSAVSQSVEMVGHVSIQNSKHNTGTTEWVKFAQISADMAVPVITDEFGGFLLDFVGLEPGTSVMVRVDKDPFEVVNQRDLMDVVVGRKSPLNVYMSEKGLLVKRQAEFYNISLEVTNKIFQSRADALQQEGTEKDSIIQQLEEDYGVKIKDMAEAISLLEQGRDEALKQLPKYALEMAYTNLDFASNLYVQAHDLYAAGNVDKAMETLDNLALENFEKEARADIKSGKDGRLNSEQLILLGEQKLDQVIESYLLKANLNHMSFEFKKVLENYTKIIAIQEDFLPNDNLTLADTYAQTSVAYRDLGKYTKALEFQMKATVIYKERFDQENLGNSYDKLSILHMNLDRMDDALDYAQKSIAIREAILAPDDPQLAESYSHIGIIFSKINDSQSGLDFLHKSIDILELQPDSNVQKLAKSYNHVAVVYVHLKKYELALEYQLKSIEAKENVIKPDELSLATSYNNISIVYRRLENYEKALYFIEKCISIREPVLDPNHPLMAKSYNNMGLVYHDMMELPKALQYMNKSIVIWEEIVHPNHNELATSYSNVSRVYQDLKRFGRALDFLLKATKIDESHKPPNASWLAVDYFKIAEVYHALGKNNEALEYANTSRQMMEQQKHFFLGRCYRLLSSIHKKRGDLEGSSTFDAKAKAIEGTSNN